MKQRIDWRAAITLDHLIREHDRLTRAMEHPQVRSLELLQAERAGIKTALAFVTGAYSIVTPAGTTCVEQWLPTLKAVAINSMGPKGIEQ
jgi:hypothetical protein